MKLYSIVAVLAVCLGLASQESIADTCQTNPLIAITLSPSNPDTAYIVTTPDDGTVTDSRTGLMWKRCSEGQSWTNGTCTGLAAQDTWSPALMRAVSSSFATHHDWRLPNVKELRSLIEECRGTPAINRTIFPAVPFQSWYWSSSPALNFRNQPYSWSVNSDNGVTGTDPRLLTHNIRLVRGGDYFDEMAAATDPAFTTALLSVGATGTGTISSDASDVNGLGKVSCTSTASSLSGTCLITLPADSPVTLTATPASGGTFNGWSGVCGGTATTCKVNMLAAQNVAASFGGGVMAPAAPTNLRASPLDGSALLTFTPGSDGGAPVTAYVASCVAGASTPTNSGLSTSITVNGLAYGTQYSCSVLARNRVGDSPPSAPVLVTPTGTCSATLGSSSNLIGSGVNSGNVSVTSNCPWTAASSDSWLSVASGATGTGNGSVVYLVAVNPNTVSRVATLTIAGKLFTVTQDRNCSFTLGSAGPNIPPAGGNGSFSVTGASSCGWNVTITDGSDSWIQVTPAPIKTGAATTTVVDALITSTGNYQVLQNPLMSARSGTLMIAGLPYVVTQDAATDASLTPVCTALTASSISISAGGSSTLTTSCSSGLAAPDSYVWSDPGCDSTLPTCVVHPSSTTTYSVAWKKLGATLALGSVDVTVTGGNTATAGTPVIRYRLYNDVTKEHLYTTDANEYSVLGTRGWIQEGAIYKLFQGPGSFSGVDAVPFYRLYNPATLQHHWTTDLHEYNVLGTQQGWTQEGTDGYILPAAAVGASPPVGALPLYRLALYAFGLHLWTIDANEKTVLTTTAGWADEGIAGYVIPLP